MYNYVLTEGSEVDYLKEHMMEENRISSHNVMEESKEEVRLFGVNRCNLKKCSFCSLIIFY